MKVAITGSSGLIGSALTKHLREEGHEIVRLVRRNPESADEARWDPYGEIDTGALEGAGAVVNLAGAGIGDKRWTSAYKQEIRDSRVKGTSNLAGALAALSNKPKVLLSGAAVGVYGDTGDRRVDETAPIGTGFLPGLVRDWEAATGAAQDAGIRVVNMRTGLVLDRQAPLLTKTLPVFKLGLGGKLGDGKQGFSWITLADWIAAVRFLIDHDDLNGPVNLTAPNPVTNAAYTKALGRALHRPAIMRVPGLAMRIAVGEFAGEVLSGQFVTPGRLTKAGFGFRHPDIDTALTAILR